ncbi:PAS domain-containing protein [Candidatus Methylospira mobilis]|uniref:PAS domain-containing protein n=1 Tax=Candidatus Methylospira mobilis TaxID=1808979 RepID=A0A5Q0BJR0_9GAMM|nr:PAS domain-containing protein [Candidatus Methylospira mobilis]QFY44115.1 PAS domain-containing protein [Candidatus Methylospira mobilis]WNV06476.1 PAS domain-containing protein [Candidatus Methylospira mobilis]
MTDLFKKLKGTETIPLIAIADALPCMIGYWDRDLRCKFANRAYLEWFGRSPDDLLGESIQDLLGKRLFDLNKPYISGALTGVKQQFERTLTKANGNIGYTLANYIPDINTEGAITGFYVLVSEVTPVIETKIAHNQTPGIFLNTANDSIIATADKADDPGINSLSHRILFASENSKWLLDTDKRYLFDPNGRVLHLTSTETDILTLLIYHCGELVTRANIISALGFDYAISAITRLNTQMSRLRQKLYKFDECLFIQTWRNRGYAYIGPQIISTRPIHSSVKR